MDTPLISFIIPFYGEASRDLLRACLQSVRSQPAMRGEDYEIILATDGSHGLGGARNCGLRQAKGVYVAFVDADDFLFPASLYIPDFLRGEAAPEELQPPAEPAKLRGDDLAVLQGGVVTLPHRFNAPQPAVL